jgi:hypothetical protein
MANINDTLDSLLRKYYHENTPANEKEACLTVFNRKCKSNNINADNYKQNYEDRSIKKDNPVNRARTRRSSSSGTDWGSDSSRNDSYDAWRYAYEAQWGSSNSYWDDIFRGHQKRKAEEETKKDDPNSYEHCKEFANVYGKFKECIYEVKMDHIKINCMRFVEGRWAIDNLIFYCGNDPKKVVKELEKYRVFTFTSNGKRYAQHLNISRLWGYKSAKEEVPIY